MKNRNRQRRNRAIKEEMIKIKDSCGINDPTPHEAVILILKDMHKRKRCQ